MTEELDPKKHIPTELARQKGLMVSRWLYGELTMRRPVTIEQVRVKVEDPTMTYDEKSDAYRLADYENEQQRSYAAQSSSEIDYEERNLSAKVKIHEDITFLLHDAETEMARDAGLFD